jgi:hypothetical protein
VIRCVVQSTYWGLAAERSRWISGKSAAMISSGRSLVLNVDGSRHRGIRTPSDTGTLYPRCLLLEDPLEVREKADVALWGHEPH